MAKQKKWQAATVDILDVMLDSENPRIDVRSNASQDLLRRKLLETSKVIELAQRIVDFGGLFPGERIIVAKESDGYVVLEGNRRTCACQLLVNPDLIPSGYKSSFPAADSDLRDAIAQVPAEVAPARESAEVTITQRHTAPGVLQWSPSANHRRIRRLLTRGRSLEDIAKSFGAKRSELTRYLREGELLQHALGLKCWSPEEREQLNSPFVKTNPFTRFFTLEGVRETVGLEFDPNHKVRGTKKKNLHEKWVEELARGFLLKGQGGKPIFNTRSSPQDVFQDIAGRSSLIRKDLEAQEKERARNEQQHEPTSETKGKSAATAGSGNSKTVPFPTGNTGSQPEQPKASSTPLKVVKFFEKLECNVSDDRLIALTKEIKRISYRDYPIAATFLSRALLESSLLYCIKKKRMYSQLMARVPGPDKKDPGLKLVIQFCLDEADKIFTNASRLRSLLNRWISKHKDYCDLVVHGEWLKANKTTLEQLSAETFPFIRKVLDDQF